MDEKNENKNNQENYPTQFNTLLKEVFDLFGETSSRMRSKIHIREMRSSLIRGMQTQEDYAIIMLGPYLWASREDIEHNRADIFISREYGYYLMQLSKKHKFSYDDAISTINHMKQVYTKSKNKFKNKIHSQLLCMVSVYAKYLLTIR